MNGRSTQLTCGWPERNRLGQNDWTLFSRLLPSSSFQIRHFNMSQRGKLIVVEGLDRAGKSTQVERLCANLCKEGRRVERMRFPGSSP